MPFTLKWRSVRLKQGLTQEEAARLLGLTRMGLQKIESGDCRAAQTTLERACKVYGCQPNDLLEFVEEDDGLVSAR